MVKGTRSTSRNTVIIATSNAGFGYEANLTEDADKPELMDRLKPYFRPEFLNRFNAVIEFSHLSKEDLSKIVDLMLVDVNKTLSKKDIDLAVSEAAKEYMTEEGYDEVMVFVHSVVWLNNKSVTKSQTSTWITWMPNISKQTWKMVSL